MKLGLLMLAGSILSVLGITILYVPAAGLDVRPAVWLGMVGPLVASVCSVNATELVFRKRPESLTAVMIVAFAAKMIFFGGYVAVVVLLKLVSPVPFALSFTAYFVVLHLTEAIHLRRLFATA